MVVCSTSGQPIHRTRASEDTQYKRKLYLSIFVILILHTTKQIPSLPVTKLRRLFLKNCEKGVFMHLRKVSANVSLRSPRRLKWAETFRYFSNFCMSKYHSTTWLSRLYDETKLGEVCAGIVHSGDALSPLLSENGSFIYARWMTIILNNKAAGQSYKKYM